MQQLTLAELNDLIWTTIDSLGSTSPFRVQAASEMLLIAVQEHGDKLKIVRALGLGQEGPGVEGGPSGQHPGLRSLSLMGESQIPPWEATSLMVLNEQMNEWPKQVPWVLGGDCGV